MEHIAEGINSALVGLSKRILEEGVWRKTPGFQAENSARCLEFPGPMTVEIKNPQARHVIIPARSWNSILPYAESLWLALGWNNLDDLPGKYVKALYKFSDDGKTWASGYGPRIRLYNGKNGDYHIGESFNAHKDSDSVDQLKFVYETLKKDPYSRQALITIHDPMKDDFNIDGFLKVTKDQPCTRSLHFMKHPSENKLNMYVTMRSNDILWGFSAVNVFNFTWMQEYVADMLGMDVGSYYHIAHNMHIYEHFVAKIQKIAETPIETAEYMDLEQSESWNRWKNLHNNINFKGEDFDNYLRAVLHHERLSWDKNTTDIESVWELPAMFAWWAYRFYLKNIPGLVDEKRSSIPYKI
jgi:thymidylate synthase